MITCMVMCGLTSMSTYVSITAAQPLKGKSSKQVPFKKGLKQSKQATSAVAARSSESWDPAPSDSEDEDLLMSTDRIPDESIADSSDSDDSDFLASPDRNGEVCVLL